MSTKSNRTVTGVNTLGGLLRNLSKIQSRAGVDTPMVAAKPKPTVRKAESVTNSAGDSVEGIIRKALRSYNFVRKFIRMYRKSKSGKVVFYLRNGEPMVMSLERLEFLRNSVKKINKNYE